MKTIVQLWLHLAEFFLKWKNNITDKILEKIQNTHLVFRNVFQKILPFVR
jgi:hypothetical protein